MALIPKEMHDFYDVVVIGGGPAGLAAAVYLARARYRVVVVEKENFGGQIVLKREVANYPGIPACSGAKLAAEMKKQGEEYGAEYQQAAALNLDTEGDIKTVRTTEGELRCFGILLATGAKPKTAGFQGEVRFRGQGVAYCAVCDGEAFQDMEIFVVGGGNDAAEESLFLAQYAAHVTMLIGGEDFNCEKAAAERVRKCDKIRVLTEMEAEAVEGGEFLTSITYRNLKTNELTTYHAPEGERLGVFVYAGYEPAVDLVKDQVELSALGYVITDRNQKTCIDGLYAAGDICGKNLRQTVTAAGDGALAAAELERYAAKLRQRTGLKPMFCRGG